MEQSSSSYCKFVDSLVFGSSQIRIISYSVFKIHDTFSFHHFNYEIEIICQFRNGNFDKLIYMRTYEDICVLMKSDQS